MKKYLSWAILLYLRSLAKLQLLKNHPLIIGVTGSAGKSSCVAAIEAILKTKYKVKTTGTGNSESGIPLAILGLKMTDYSPLDWLRVLIFSPLQLLSFWPKYEILVAEMGVDELKPPKNMGYLLTIIRPQIGVFLNVLPVHTLQMKSLKNIAREKGRLIASLPPNGTAIVNANDPRTQIKTRAKVVFFSGDSLSAAKTVGKILGISLATSNQQLATSFHLPSGRWSIFSGIQGSTLIDSSYNASPIPVTLALERLHAQKAGRHIAVLGDMRELGKLAASEHKMVAKEAFRLADKIITVGPLTQKYFPRHPKIIASFANSYQAGKFLQTFLQPGDLVLFKGSQNTIFLETAVEMCLAHKSDVARLCRRGMFWDKQRLAFKI